MRNMPSYIVKIEGAYLTFSSVSDAFIRWPMTRAELKHWHDEEFGRSGRFDERMERVDQKGTSAIGDDSWEDTVCCNRAGLFETHLEAEQIRAAVRAYLQELKQDQL